MIKTKLVSICETFSFGLTGTMIILFLALLLSRGEPQVVSCVDQLHNLYVAKGMALSVLKRPLIKYETGYKNPGNISYVSAIIHIEETVAYYTRHITTNTTPDRYTVSYVSFDVPLCTTSVTVTCVDDSASGLMGKTNCTNIIDQDLGFPSLLAGRLYIHLDHLSPCNGTVNVTFMNTYLQQTRLSTRYVYDISGVIDERITPLAINVSRAQYLASGCDYSDGTSFSFAASQRQFACIDQTIGCLSLNQVTAVAPPDFTVNVAACDSVTPSRCILLNGSASFQTGTGSLYYLWEVVAGWPLSPPIFDNVTCNDFTSGLFNKTGSVACAIFRYSGLYQFNLTVYDNTTAISTDSVYINVIVEGGPLVLPNETIGPYPSPPPRTDPPIGRPIIQFPTSPPQPFIEAPVEPAPPYPNTTVASLSNEWPPLTTGQTFAILIIVIANTIVFVIFVGLYIALMPSNETNFRDRVRYFH